MIGLEEGVLPHSRARGNPTQMEEERRLCFVGITRAQERLILTKANYRTNRGLRERTATSPFLVEMPQDQLQVTDRAGIPFDREDRALERELAEAQAESNVARYRPGQRVRHDKFGIGTIKDVSNMGQHTRAEVDFHRVGKKTFILEYTKLEVV
jgi:DNA helicase-2/ATP-dependent DNA helicase PcrA